MKTTRLFLPLLAAIGIAHADVTITQQIETPQSPEPSVMEMKIKDGKVRTDVNPEMTAIFDSKTGDTLTLMHKQKAVLKIPGAMLQEARKQAMDDPKIQEPKPTGRKDTISGYECEEFVTEVDGNKVEIWMATNVPDSDELLKELALLDDGTNPAGSIFGKSNLKGIPVRSVVTAPGQGTIRMTLVSINRDKIPASEFAIPTGYREVSMPSLPIPGAE